MLPDTLASKAYDSYQLETMALLSICRSSRCQRRQSDVHSSYGIVPTRHHRMGNLHRTATPSKRIFRQNSQHYMYIRRVYPVRFLGYLLRYKPIKNILMVFAVLIAAAWICHEIGSIVQEHAKKLNGVSRQVVDDTYKEIEGIREKERNADNDSLNCFHDNLVYRDNGECPTRKTVINDTFFE